MDKRGFMKRKIDFGELRGIGRVNLDKSLVSVKITYEMVGTDEPSFSEILYVDFYNPPKEELKEFKRIHRG